MLYQTSNDPNPGRLISSLRHLGYGNYEAVADVVDNSLDAEARTISIRIFQHEGQIEIWIADDGVGMDLDTLDQAMRLGSLTARNQNSDLGKFGMGLVTASLSIARRCHVITRGGEGALSSAWDVDEIIKENQFLKHLDRATSDEEQLLSDLIGKQSTGTLLMLTKIDNLTNKNTTSFASNLKSHLGRVHRYFLKAGVTININGENILPLDPLEIDDSKTEIVMDEHLSVNSVVDGKKQVEDVRVRIVLLPEDPTHELAIDKSMKAQGFYVMRNQRELMDAVTLDFFTKHNDFNRMRGEIFFPGTLDHMVGIEFTKRQVRFDQSLKDQLGSVIRPTCITIKRREGPGRRATKTSAVQQELHARSAKAITEKDKLLIKPKAKIEKRSSATNVGNGSRKDGGAAKERKEFNRTQDIESKLGCEIREENMGPNGQIYESDVFGRKIILRYNVEHPFYQRFVLDNLDEPRIVTAVDFLIYSMASAEHKLLDDEGANEVINNFKAVMSANMRTLLN